MRPPIRGCVALTLLLIAAARSNAGLLAYYSFDSDYSLTAGSYAGTLSEFEEGGATVEISTTAGKFGGAADFTSTTGNQAYLRLSEAISFAADEAWSVAFWQRRRSGSDDRVGMILGDRSDTNNFVWVSLGQLDGIRFRNSSGNNFDFGAAVNNDYVHWVLVADGTGNVSAYRNGVADSQNPIDGTSTFSINTIGQAYNASTFSMNGQIDELYIFDEAIDTAKIAELYAGTPDETPPTLLGSDIVDNRGGGPVTVSSTVTYTVTFSEDMDDATVDATDFGNAGSSSFGIGSVTETSAGVFSVEVTPTSAGTLQLQVNQDAILSDPAGNNLDTTSAIPDDTVITVELTDSTPPTLTGGDFADDQGGGPVTIGTPVTYTISFSEDMDENTVDAADFGNAGTADFSIGAITEISPGVFSLVITPTTAGTLRLQVKADAVLADAAGNPMDTTGAITSNVIIDVEEGFDPSNVKRLRVFLLGGQSNADGRADPSELPTSPVNLQLPQDDVDFYESALTTLRPVGSQFGPEVTLGRRLADSIGNEPGTRVAIIKYAVGGTSLSSDWAAGGDATTANDGPRYVSFQNVVANGLAGLATAYPDAAIEINGMLWVQGERDAGTSEAANYETNLAAFIADIRLTYGSGLWFVVSRLSDNQTAVNSSGLATVRAAQSNVAAADPLAALLNTDGFGMKSDNLHFNGLGQQHIGDGAAEWLLDFAPFIKPLEIDFQANGDFEVVVNQAFEGFLYTLQGNSGLQPENWESLETITASGPVVSFSVSPASDAERGFYRIDRSKAP